MKKNLLLFILSFFCIFQLNAQMTEHTITHNNEVREYQIYLPSNYESGQSLPLVLNLHGLGSNNGQQAFYSNFNATADEGDFIICYPQGLVAQMGLVTGTHWNTYFQTGVDDLGFIDKLIDKIWTDYDIDLSRVYSTGMSNGGYMSYVLACELSDRIAAIASVTGNMTFEGQANCVANRAVPVMQIHGTEDAVVDFNGTPLFAPTIPDAVNFWIEHNNCNIDAKVTTDIDDSNMTDDSTVSLEEYPECDEGTRVHFYTVDNGGHTWPGAFPVAALGNTNQDISATPIIWEFFSQFTHPDPREGALVATHNLALENSLKIFPNPFHENLVIKNLSQKKGSIQLVNSIGQVLFQKDNLNSFETHEVAGSELESGIYFLIFEQNGQFARKKVMRF